RPRARRPASSRPSSTSRAEDPPRGIGSGRPDRDRSGRPRPALEFSAPPAGALLALGLLALGAACAQAASALASTSADSRSSAGDVLPPPLPAAGGASPGLEEPRLAT